jgi:D-beta-D-heptose 7-phosphate kinase/D-beta-D-heptose 1-phosphate adenosyltransferase
VISDYAKGVITPELSKALIHAANEARVPVVVDPKSDDLDRYRGSTVMKPNLSEAIAACGRNPVGPDGSLDLAVAEQACLELARRAGVRNVVLSLASNGVVVSGEDVPVVTHFQGTTLQVAEVSGAGDTMVAVLAAGMAVGLPLERSVRVANIAASAVCAKAGTAVLTGAELLDAVLHVGAGSVRPGKVLASYHEAARMASMHRRDGRRVAFANGCFDLLHAGHVHVLQEARAAADALIVAINSDESTRRLKGPGRPVQSESDRADVLASLACVDGVVIFAEDTPLELILTVRPDLIVKGGDYSAEDVVGSTEAKSWGGKTKIVELLEGRSTTRLLERRGPGEITEPAS